MKKITCLIVDDEPLALDLLESYIQKTPFLELKGKCSSAVEAMESLMNDPVELLFMDIQMPELNGLKLAHAVPKRTKVIFCTAFKEYALEGFKADALDYLVKPFDYDTFLKAAEKAKTWFEMSYGKSGVGEGKSSEPEFFFVKSDYKQRKIELDDILYFEGLKDYVKIWVKNEKLPILTLMTLKKIAAELPKRRFMRVHRSYIVALDKIQMIERGQIVIDKARITVADPYKDEFQAFLDSNRI